MILFFCQEYCFFCLMILIFHRARLATLLLPSLSPPSGVSVFLLYHVKSVLNSYLPSHPPLGFLSSPVPYHLSTEFVPSISLTPFCGFCLLYHVTSVLNSYLPSQPLWGFCLPPVPCNLSTELLPSLSAPLGFLSSSCTKSPQY